MKNNKIILAISTILISSILSAGCMMMGGGMDMGGKSKGGMDMDNSKQAPKTNKSTSKCGDDMYISKNGVDKSYVIAQRYCTQCHVMREPDEFSQNQWKPILRRMMGYMQNQARLQPDEYETVMIEHYYGVE